jgi:hypothetical protein
MPGTKLAGPNHLSILNCRPESAHEGIFLRGFGVSGHQGYDPAIKVPTRGETGLNSTNLYKQLLSPNSPSSGTQPL